MDHEEQFLREQRESQITDWLKEWGEEPPNVDIADFEEAYRRIREQRSDRPPRKCRLLRRLLRQFFNELKTYFK